MGASGEGEKEREKWSGVEDTDVVHPIKHSGISNWSAVAIIEEGFIDTFTS